MAYRIVDPAGWARAAHCAAFRNSAQPQYCVTFELDVTRFLASVRRRGDSFTFAFIYAVSRCANAIEAFRYRFVDGQVALFDRIDTSFTYLTPGSELFKVVSVPMQDTMEAYVALASRTAAAQEACFTGPMGNDIFQFSAFPWVSYTHISHTDSGRKDNATPLFDWGRYTEKDGVWRMPFSVQAHHSFVDGVHIGRLADALQAYLDAC